VALTARGRKGRLVWAFACLAGCAPPTPAEVDTAAPAEQVLEEINALRRARALAPLVRSPALTGYAAERAQLAARRGSLELGVADDQLVMVKQAGYEAWELSTIVAQAAGDGREVVQAWRREAGQTFSDTLQAKFRDVGVGVAEADSGQPPIYVVVLGFSWRDYFIGRTAALADREAVRAELLAGTNQVRAGAHALPLRASPRLDRVAQEYAEKMLREAFYEHTAPDGSTVLERVRSTGYALSSVGENLALGQFSPDDVVAGWESSPGHRRNMVDRDFREVGHGVAYGHNANGWQVLWVQVFATPR
jgi:uncharacterized protein YkwD